MTRLVSKVTSVLVTALAATAFVSSLSAIAGEHPKGEPAGDIVEVATAAGQFNTLAAALEAANLIDTLKSDGPFTVFAPTDEAFAALPEGTVESLLRPENRDQLVSILTYHVVSGKVTSSEVVTLDAAETVNGRQISIDVTDGIVQINDATVVAADVAASNGIIHVIDTVILPN